MFQLAGILGVALVLTGGAFKLYVDKSEAEKEALSAQLRVAADNQVALESSVEQLNDQILKAEARQQEMYDRVSQLQIDNARSQQEVESIRKKFAKHDMTVLSLRKPGLIENIINRGTKEVLGDLETITDPSS
jgi:peptidoglycan hydrolase CwlO-like protein